MYAQDSVCVAGKPSAPIDEYLLKYIYVSDAGISTRHNWERYWYHSIDTKNSSGYVW